MYHLYVMGGQSGRVVKSFKIMGCDAVIKAVELVKSQLELANVSAVWVIDLNGVAKILYRKH